MDIFSIQDQGVLILAQIIITSDNTQNLELEIYQKYGEDSTWVFQCEQWQDPL